MEKITLFLSFVFALITLHAKADSKQPGYLDKVVTTSDCTSNWFISAQGGASVFCGIPLGCADMFDRTAGTFNLSIGKWLTPSTGLRLSYQTGKFKNCNLDHIGYNALHADLLYNVASCFHHYGETLPRWDVVPYLGMGIAFSNLNTNEQCNSNELGHTNHPFTLNYGIQIGYRVAERLKLTAELGNVTTFQDFDGTGSAARLGDNIGILSFGLSYTLGKNGYKQIIDARPYMHEVEILRARINDMRGSDLNINDNSDTEALRDGSYSGLASLKARLSCPAWDGNTTNAVKNDSIPHFEVGVPVLFFFQIDTTKLINDSQLINLDEIAKLVKEKNLVVQITGAADSATGDIEHNCELAKQRTMYIARELKNRGVPVPSMKGYSLGGVDTYSPSEANRFTKVILIEH